MVPKLLRPTHYKTGHNTWRTTIGKEVASIYPSELKTILTEGDYSPEQVYNCHKTGLYFKLLPAKTLAQKTITRKSLGFRQQKNRLTALLCRNSTGSHKLKL